LEMEVKKRELCEHKEGPHWGEKEGRGKISNEKIY